MRGPPCSGLSWRAGRMLALVSGLSCLLSALPVMATLEFQALEYGNGSRAWIEVVSLQPRAYVLHGFLSDAEADHIVQLASPSLERSRVVDSVNGTGKLDPVRTSSGTFLAKGSDEVVARIERRVATATHLPVSHAENIQVLRYELDQEYKAHYDVIETTEKTALGMQQMANPRVATLLMYLTDVEEGGETTFPGGKWLDKEAQLQPPYSQCGQKGVAVKPRKGDALLFFSLHVNGKKKDAYSLHAGCPVVRGTKFSATSWIHVAPFGTLTAQQSQANYGVCRDNNPNCPKWAAAGECTRNPGYMRGRGTVRGHCRLSCKVCRVCAAGDVLCARENERPVPSLATNTGTA
ncbi:hypothetical protein ABPG77_007646 [Micractinium sp. CCAP 211/92]